jgi:hypothetical protein
MQEDLLLRIMETVEAAGARLAIQSQTVYLATDGNTPEDGVPIAPTRVKAAEKVAL